MKATLREKKLKDGKCSLYLDFYPAIQNPETGKDTRREFLSLYVFDNPKTDIERTHNKGTRLLARNICAQRQLDIQAHNFGFLRNEQAKKQSLDFVGFFRDYIENRYNKSESASYSWMSAFNHFSDFCKGNCRFGEVTEQLIEDFRVYLLTKAVKRGTRDGKVLSPNSASEFFGRFTTIVKTAYRHGLLEKDATLNVKQIPHKQTKREFLTIEELKRLAKTPGNIPDELRRAALFSALTGLRYSDIEKLVWSEVQQADGDYFIYLTVKKTGESEIFPIKDEAAELLGMRGDDDKRVFPTLHYTPTTNLNIGRWLLAAGINKPMTFHGFRHTFATAQITLGTDIYTVSKMLGHASVKQTEIYAKLINSKKREAANKISLK